MPNSAPIPNRRNPGRSIFLVAAVTVLVACGTFQATADETERIVEILRLTPGEIVADVGAGNGKWSAGLAERVGEGGHVFATEVDEDEIETMRRRFADDELANVTVVLGDDVDTGLAEGCCDAILVRMVYHHFTDPARMRASLYRALRPGGRIAILDIVPQKKWRELDGVPDRGGHGLEMADLIEEMTSDGFTVLSRHENWNGEDDRYAVVFEAAAKTVCDP